MAGGPPDLADARDFAEQPVSPEIFPHSQVVLPYSRIDSFTDCNI